MTTHNTNTSRGKREKAVCHVTPQVIAGKASTDPVKRCLNLVPSEIAPGIAAAIPYRTLPIPEDARMVCVSRMSGDQGPTLFYIIGNNLLGRRLQADGATFAAMSPDTVWEADGYDIYCAVAESDRLIVMTDRGVVVCSYKGDGDWEVTSTASDCAPGLYLSSYQQSAVTARVAARELSKAYPGQSEIDEKDRAALCSDLENAYLEASRDAASTGSFIQPVVARIKCYDTSGNLVWVSPPQLITHPQGLHFEGTVDVRSDDRRNVYGYDLVLDTWRLRLYRRETSEGEAAPDIARAEIWVSPQIHPYSPAEVGHAYPLRNTSDNILAHVTLPGIGSGLAGGTADSASAIVAAIVSRLDVMERMVGVVVSPFASGVIPVTGYDIAAGASGDASAESRRLDAVLSAAYSSTASTVGTETYTAREVLRMGDRLLWGRLALCRRNVPGLSSFALSFSNVAWQGYVCVRFTDGSVVVTQSGGAHGCPLWFGPAVYLPYPDVESVELCVSTADSLYISTFSPKPVSSGGSIYMAAGCKPFQLDEAVPPMLVPQEQTLTRDLPDMVACSALSRPGAFTAVATTEGDVTALSPAVGSDSAWDFGRSRACVYTSSGIFSVRISADMTRLSVNRLCDAGVGSRAGVCHTPLHSYAAAGSDILALGGTSAVRLGSAPGAVSVAFDPLAGALLVGRSDGSCDMWLLDSTGKRVTGKTARSFTIDPQQSLHDPLSGIFYVKSGSSLVLTGTVAEQSSTSVGYDIDLCHPDSMSRGKTVLPGKGRVKLAGVRILGAASAFFGTIAFYRTFHGGVAAAQPELSLNIQGPLRSLPEIPMIWRGADGIRVSIDGLASSDFFISSILIF